MSIPCVEVLKLLSLTTGMERKVTLDDFKVGSVPTLIYIPDFITDNEQTMLLNKVEIPLPYIFPSSFTMLY